MTTTTPTTALADLENLTRYDYVPSEAGRMIIGQDDEGGYLLRSDVLALACQVVQPVAPVQDVLSAWKVLADDDKPDTSRRLDVILANGVTLESHSYSQIDWTQVSNWRYSAPSPQIAEVAELPPAGWARKRDNGTGFGNWLFQTKEGAEKHGETGDGYSVVALVERDAIAASCRAAPNVDDLAQFIRKVDGNHSMGAGALAEKIVEWLAAQPAEGAGQAEKCRYCGGEGEHYQGPSQYRDCEACDGTGGAGQANSGIPKRAWSKEAEMVESWANLDAGQAGQVAVPEIDLSTLDRYIIQDDEDERPDIAKAAKGGLVLFSDVEDILSNAGQALKVKPAIWIDINSIEDTGLLFGTTRHLTVTGSSEKFGDYTTPLYAAASPAKESK